MITNLSFGQEYNNKAIKLTDKAQEALKNRDFDGAQKFLKKAISKDETYPLAYLRLAHIYNVLIQKDSAVLYYNRYLSVSNPSKIDQKLLANIAALNFDQGNYQKSSDILTYVTNPDLRLKSSVTFSLHSIMNPRNIFISEFPKEVNAFDQQYFPVLTVDENTIIYTKKGSGRNDDEDLVYSEKVNDAWLPAQSLSDKINTKFNEGACAISADGRTLIFTACEGRETFGSCDLFISYKQGEVWSEPENLGPTVNSPSWDSQPSLSADGRILYFSSNRPGGFGKRDIWVTKLQKSGWSQPQNLGEIINTSFDDTTPFIHANGRQLFFSSSGHTGMGGFDLFSSELKNRTWSAPTNLGFPINSHLDEISMFINRSGNTSYYSVEQTENGRVVSSRLVKFEMHDMSLVSDRAGYVTGYVYNEFTGTPLSAKLEMTNLNDSSEYFVVQSDSITGRYFLVLTEGSEYGVFINKSGYLFEDYTFRVEGKSINDPVIIDIPLKPIEEGLSIVLENIYFEFDSYTLNKKSISELNGIITFLLDNPEVYVEVQGHTDNVGVEAYNLKLSEKRSKEVCNYLINNGIDAERMSFTGLGSIDPIADNNTEGGRKANRRINFKLISIIEK